MSGRRKELVPRFRAATLGRHGVERARILAYVIRNGLAIHPTAFLGLGGVARFMFVLSATGCGYRLARFEHVEQAERALLRLEGMANWARMTPKEAAALGPKVTPILKRLGDLR